MGRLESMTRGLVGLWKEAVGPRDKVQVIGDFARVGFGIT